MGMIICKMQQCTLFYNRCWRHWGAGLFSVKCHTLWPVDQFFVLHLVFCGNLLSPRTNCRGKLRWRSLRGGGNSDLDSLTQTNPSSVYVKLWQDLYICTLLFYGRRLQTIILVFLSSGSKEFCTCWIEGAYYKSRQLPTCRSRMEFQRWI